MDAATVDLPDRDRCLEWFRTMLLIRRFEERAGELYTRAKIGGFLHLAIGEEAAIVGTVAAMRSDDYLFSTYREHGQALARGMEPERVMAELFGKQTGCSQGRGGSMHLFDLKRRVMGGYGIVGGNLPIAVGAALASDYRESDEVTVCMLGDGATNQGTFGESLNLAALWNLPVVFVVMNNRFGMGTALSRHSAQPQLSRKGEGYGVSGSSCNGMDVAATHSALSAAINTVRVERKPLLVEVLTYRFRGHSMADPERYRSKEEVEQWRLQDPLTTFPERLRQAGYLTDELLSEIEREVQDQVEQAVGFAEESPFPAPESLYDNIYVLGDQVKPWYSLDSSRRVSTRGEDLRRDVHGV